MKRGLVLLVTMSFVILFVAEGFAVNKSSGDRLISTVKEGQKKDIVFGYSAGKRRDPFTPLIVKKDVKPRKGLIPLENYDVSEFKLIGILWNKKGYYAVVVLPDGKAFNIKEGNRLGLYGGSVFKITKDSVIIKEKIKDRRGALISRDTILKLRKEEEG